MLAKEFAPERVDRLVSGGARYSSLCGATFSMIPEPPNNSAQKIMRNDYLQNALLVITDPNILVNVVSRRVKQLRQGHRPLVESLEKLSAEDTALREISEGRITYELPSAAEMALVAKPSVFRRSVNA